MRTFEVNIGNGIVEVYEFGDDNKTALSLIDHLLARISKLEKSLGRIAKKVPHQVSREEAADMACEFAIEARAALDGRDEKGKGV